MTRHYIRGGGRHVRAYHGTQRTALFTRFAPAPGSFGGAFNAMGSWFASTPEAAAIYARPMPGGPPGRLYTVSIALRNPWVIDFDGGRGWDQIANYIGHANGEHGWTGKNLRNVTAAHIAAFRERLGARSALEIRDFYEEARGPHSTIYVVFDPADITILGSMPVPR